MTTAGRLYVVATPIGNLGDVSQRMRDTLAAVAVVAAEDTRHTGRLLRSLGIGTPLLSLHEHNERERSGQLVARLQAGEDVALVSDAGTPLLSDPGFTLVRAAIAAGVTVVPVPGPCAAIAALSVAGLPTDRFCFEGFPAARPAARRGQLAAVAAEPRTLVFYEAPQRLAASLADMAEILGPTRRATVARELTKAFETVYHGDLATLAARAAADADMTRGEIVVVVEGQPRAPADEGDVDRILRILLASLPPSQAAGLAAEIAGAPRNACYRRAQEIAREGG